MPQIYQTRWQHWRRMEITVESENKRKANPVKACSSCKAGQIVLEMERLLGKCNTAPPHLTYHSTTQPWRGWRWHCQALLISILFLKLPPELKLAYDLQSSHAPKEPSTQEGRTVTVVIALPVWKGSKARAQHGAVSIRMCCHSFRLWLIFTAAS